MARVLVTGAAGFIGAHLALRLAAEGHVVHALDVRPLPEPLLRAGITHHAVDMRDSAAVESLLDDIDVVHHLASAHLEVHRTAAFYEQVNVLAAAALAAACAKRGVRRLVHASSVGVYGHVAEPPAREDSSFRPGTLYERTKLAGEQAVARVAAGAGLDVIVLRPAWVYGPGCRRTAKLLRGVARGRFAYVGDGCTLRHPIHVDDVVDAFLIAAAAPAGANGGCFIIAGPRSLPLRELVETCARVLGVAPPRRRIPRALALVAGRGAELAWGAIGREPPISRRTLSFFENDNAFDTTAAARDLGFVARIELEDGLRRTIADATRWSGLPGRQDGHGSLGRRQRRES
jgi:nucleoside-diphosphate-sugar epimerase